MNFENIALKVPEILLPRKGTDLTRWAVVACDQYTSQPDYWVRVEQFVGQSASTFRLILPEAYLESSDKEKVGRKISTCMTEYLEEGILTPQNPGFILVDRRTSQTPSRKGLVVALDLEHYDFSAESKSLIRATEGTVLDRIPPRIHIRKDAVLEVPHIMVLIDDPEKTVIEPLFRKTLNKVYDVELMMNSGHVTGYIIDDKETIGEIAHNLERLADKDAFNKKYRVTNEEVLLYAMGDGNHSLATAKSLWKNIKEQAQNKDAIMQHPARYALVELVNIHDEGLEFEPIHRAVFNIQAEDMLQAMQAFYEQQGSQFSYTMSNNPEELHMLREKSPGTHQITFVSEKIYGILSVNNPRLNLEVGTLQTFLDHYVQKKPEVKIDYIHGDDIVTDLGSQAGNMGFHLPAISKHDLFKTIIVDGALPRKTFSMGNADEKRFYLECRKISQ